MANPGHVAVVKQGAEAIAEWRRQHPEGTLDLWEADLSGADLSGADLSGAYLSGAYLWNADLSGANLAGADLAEANLSSVSLSKANLSGAYLILAYLNAADLSGADFKNAEFLETTIVHCDLSRSTGLDTTVHKRPSSIGTDTLIASFRGSGNDWTPELITFFLGAGVPRELLDAFPQIVREIKYHSCFISYGEPDREFAERLREGLKARGVTCWFYPADYTPGVPPEREIKQKIGEYEKLVVICSYEALVRKNVLTEIEEQIRLNPDNIIPILIDHTWRENTFPVRWKNPNTKAFLDRPAYADFSDPSQYEDSLALLLRGLERKDRPVPSPTRGEG